MEELRGKAVADNLHVEIAKQTEKLKAKGITPKLAVVRVGAREDDLAYERGILKKFANNNVDVIVKELPLDVDQETLDKEVKTLNEDPTVNGILMFRPLPKHLTDENIKSFIDPGKDVDVMGYGNMAGLFAGDKDAYAPCTAQAVMEILNFYGIETKGKNVTVIGRSLVIGKPVTLLLIGANATVTVCHTKTRDIKEECRRAD
ncbi:MAG: bifunctional 5,10-methylenetetrahydrofolate dehydrogenase/5,10-methenyltetrahydrofolate cyclohydrolase, partial [Clostridiales bacterium]|nr:bifunctional 5,10-methylenetetrahydrofolate dehydrogenase/5,10-methenyltetrahydrofolate cyclohydrolase [Clostridiales bacterium]